MAVVEWAGKRITCLAADTKPTTGLELGAMLTETDTRKDFCWSGSVWNESSYAGGGGAPVGAEYVVTAAHADLTAEKILSSDIIAKGTLASRPAAASARTAGMGSRSRRQRRPVDTRAPATSASGGTINTNHPVARL